MGRYCVTGVQLGILLAYLELGKNEEATALIDKIIDKQYIGEPNREDIVKALKETKRI